MEWTVFQRELNPTHTHTYTAGRTLCEKRISRWLRHGRTLSLTSLTFILANAMSILPTHSLLAPTPYLSLSVSHWLPFWVSDFVVTRLIM